MSDLSTTPDITSWAEDPALKTAPFGHESGSSHQWDIYQKRRDDANHGLFLEPGLGKTWIMLAVASHRYLRKEINGLLVVAPKSVYKNWLTQEIPQHLAAPAACMAYHTSKSRSFRSRTKQLVFLDPSEFAGKLKILCLSYDSLCTDRGREFVEKFCALYDVMMVLDESTAIKSPKTATAKTCKAIGAMARCRWIATGTPVANSPFDAHSQIEFMDRDFWRERGLKSREAFKAEFGIFVQKRAVGRVFAKTVGYRNLPRLTDMISSISTRLLKEDSSVRLPPKVYSIRTFKMSEPQVTAYNSLRRSFQAELDAGITVEASLAITRMMRLQQITSGFVTAEETLGADGSPIAADALLDDDESAQEVLGDSLETMDPAWSEAKNSGEYARAFAKARGIVAIETQLAHRMLGSAALPEVVAAVNQEVAAAAAKNIRVTRTRIVDVVDPTENPRLLLLREIVDEITPAHKLIVWARFKRDVQLITELLGDLCVKYDGSVGAEDREIALRRFRDPDDPCRVLVANQYAISQGVTLTIGKTAVYYSNTSSLEKRLQSEDREHRIGQTESVHIIDMIAEGTIDRRLVEGLRRKFKLAAEVSGDRFRAWIGDDPAEVGG
jgi:SNF2 family DNA or RNA helicase